MLEVSSVVLMFVLVVLMVGFPVGLVVSTSFGFVVWDLGSFFGCLEGWFFCGLGGGFLSRFFVWYSLADGPAGWIVAAYAAGYKIEHFKVKIIVGFVLWFILALFCGGFAR